MEMRDLPLEHDLAAEVAQKLALPARATRGAGSHPITMARRNTVRQDTLSPVLSPTGGPTSEARRAGAVDLPEGRA